MKQFKVKLNEGESARVAAQLAKGGEAIIIVKSDFVYKLARELKSGADAIFLCEHRKIKGLSIKRLYRKIEFYKDHIRVYERGLNCGWSYLGEDRFAHEDFFVYEKENLAELCEVYGFDGYENLYEYAACKCDLISKSMSGQRLTNPYLPCSAFILCSTQSP